MKKIELVWKLEEAQMQMDALFAIIYLFDEHYFEKAATDDGSAPEDDHGYFQASYEDMQNVMTGIISMAHGLKKHLNNTITTYHECEVQAD